MDDLEELEKQVRGFDGMRTLSFTQSGLECCPRRLSGLSLNIEKKEGTRTSRIPSFYLEMF